MFPLEINMVKNPFKIYLFIIASVMLLLLNAPVSVAQRPISWNEPARIPGYDDDTLPPILLADQAGVIHAFTSQWTGDATPQLAIFYNQWTLNGGWTSPVDILLSPLGEARITGAFLDQSGKIHVIFFGGDELEGNIYYSWAPANQAGTARAWSEPKLIGMRAISPSSAALAGDDSGNLVVVYSGDKEGNGYYSIESTDLGETWSEPKLIFTTNDDNLWAYGINMDIDPSGILHAAWNVVDVAGQGRGIYYSSMNMKDKQWSDSQELVQTPTGLGAWWPDIIEHNGQVILIYNFPSKIVMRTSRNGGQSWTNPAILFPRHGGVNGTISIVRDGNDDLHLFWGQRIPGAPDIHGMWHSKWENGYWSNPDAVVSGPRVVDQTGYDGFDPYDARAVISQGNTILATWRSDPGNIKPNGVWYSYSVLDLLPSNNAAPQAETLSEPTPSPTEHLDDADNTNLPSVPTAIIVDTGPQKMRDQLTSSDMLIAGVLPVTLVLLLLILWYSFQKSR